MNRRESYYIKLFNTLAPNGYNLNTGGDRWKDSPQTIERKTKANRINANKPGNIEKQRKARKLFLLNNPDYSSKHSLKLKKRFNDDPSLRELSSKLKGGKYFKVFNKNTLELVWEGINQAQCQRDLGVSQSNISNCLNLKKKTCNGYIFRYIGEEKLVWLEKTGVKRNVVNKNTGEIFKSLSSAAIKYNSNTSNIARAAKNGTKCAGYNWGYL
jgi:hypothetical protein